MQTILSVTRKAVGEYNLIQEGDRIGVGLSGGKDSLLLFLALARLRRFIGIESSLVGLTLDLQMQNRPTDYSAVSRICEREGVMHHIRRTNIGSIVFDQRKEKNPCSLCARMRRGALHDFAKENGCNKIALGHHFDDVVETFMMNLFQEGRLGCFSPKSYLSRKDLTMIRPLIYATEEEIKQAVKEENLPVIPNPCPADGHSQREKTKQWLAQMERENQGIKRRIFGAICRAQLDGYRIFPKNS